MKHVTVMEPRRVKNVTRLAHWASLPHGPQGSRSHDGLYPLMGADIPNMSGI